MAGCSISRPRQPPFMSLYFRHFARFGTIRTRPAGRDGSLVPRQQDRARRNLSLVLH